MSEALHVLVVDDEPRIRTMVRRYLTEEGLKVSEAGDGATMRRALEHEAIDLVLLDLVMPGEDGLSLAREIRRSSEVPIIMVTGKGDLIDRVVGLEAGADDYIAKPFLHHPNRVLSRDQLMDLAKGRDWAAYDRTIDTQVMRLRKKIETDPANPGLIKTVRGAGYLFAAVVRPG
jgi:DNA-binding response OmpR family regulator